MPEMVKLNSDFNLRRISQTMYAQTKTLPAFKLLAFALLFVLVSLTPLFLHTQWFTGPLVNAALIMAVILVGPMEAIILGLIPSSVALSSGLLPLPLAPMVPFIMMSNAVFVAIFAYMQPANYWLALGIASVLKFAFLSLTVSLLMGNLLPGNLLAQVAVMMSWPQLVTALIGGVIAFGILKSVEYSRRS